MDPIRSQLGLSNNTITNSFKCDIREDTHKKKFFFVVGPLRGGGGNDFFLIFIPAENGSLEKF